MRLLLIRHGETDANRKGLALGRADVSLNDIGVLQTRALGRRLANERIAAVYSSPLERAVRTAEAVAAPHGIGVAIHDGLIEMDVGEIDGLPFSEVRVRHPGLLERWTSADGPSHPMPGGEALADVAMRAWDTAMGFSKHHRDETIAAVTHNFVILSLLTRVMGIDLANFRRLRHGLAAVTVLEFRRDRARVLALNDGCHLNVE